MAGDLVFRVRNYACGEVRMSRTKDLEALLAKRKEELALEHSHQWRKSNTSFRQGFDSLAPLLIEMAEALEKLTLNEENQKRLVEVDAETLRMILLYEHSIAAEALASVAKKLGGE